MLVSLLAVAGISCSNTGGNTSAPEEPQPATDTVSYTGVVIDGAMNSIFIKTAAGDSLSFGYPNLNHEKIQSYMINDTVTINTRADTVISIINDSTR